MPKKIRRRDFYEQLLRFLGSFDYLQILALGLLLGLGVLFIHSTGLQIGSRAALGAYLKQLQWIAVGGGAYCFFALADYRRLNWISIIFYLGCIFLLVMVFIIGIRVFGAQRWILVPGINLRLQPSELTKLAVILVLAALFASRLFAIDDTGERGGRKSGQLLGLITAVIIIAIPFVLIVRQPDLGSALILPPIGAAIILVAGIRWRSLAIILAVTLIAFTLFAANEIIGVKPLLKEYQRERILTFLDPERDLAHRGHNQYQARIAVGSGGLHGKGLGQGTQNSLGFLPQTVSNNDFIFAVIAEETGFAGSTGLILLYALLLFSIFRTAIVAVDRFGRYLAVGAGTMIFTHIYINIGMSIGLAPVTGLPLPFVSYGGSFIMTGLMTMGILQNIYRTSRLART